MEIFESTISEMEIADQLKEDLRKLVRDKYQQGYRLELDWVEHRIIEIIQQCTARERILRFKELYREVKEDWNHWNSTDPIEGYSRLES